MASDFPLSATPQEFWSEPTSGDFAPLGPEDLGLGRKEVKRRLADFTLAELITAGLMAAGGYAMLALVSRG